MQTETGELFYSKIMLFGEYTIINGSMGLTIPYSHFNGQLAFPNRNSYTDLAFAQRSNQHLYEFWFYLHTLATNGDLLCDFDTDRLKSDLDNGLYFESTIPEGYGLGSSGALVAAFFQKYVSNAPKRKDLLTPQDIRKLKEQLAQLETWFHGTSSGIDPLICFMKHPLLLRDLDHIEPVGLPSYQDLKTDGIFLINSGKPGKTAPLVQGFMEKYNNDKEFYKFVEHKLTPLNNSCIINLIENRKDYFYSALKELSSLQEQKLQKMVPDSVRALWRNGLKSDSYYLKLCGSGGGGYVLGFTRDFPNTKNIIEKEGWEIIPVYHDLKKHNPNTVV
ncbi:mevalonate kinase family protein [Thermophagus xiamenensis]|uniref:Mevalonate kinase n=1 Tax=Thermophagus xiamenensis TaxID=385682 RepID=A0A1I2F3B3_9BACT|nr:mevalonate kinase [Thermophagus xiamenensis]SFE99914.1 mevalonate kinase [Thermophagus xiamenensis]